jgi:hypothetical protein
MKIKPSWLSFLFCLSFLPIPAFAQCQDQHDRHCWNLQYILYAAQTDFREFQPPEELSGLGLFPDNHRRTHASALPNPDASLAEANVPCQVSAWLNGVGMYLCQGGVSVAEAEEWYAKTLADLQQLQYLWQFKIETRDTDHYVDAGPPGCEVARLDGPYVADGPYLGQCPLHLQAVKQPNGMARVYLWLTSYTSPFLVRRPDLPFQHSSQYLRAAESAPPAPMASGATALSSVTFAPAGSSSSANRSSAPTPTPASATVRPSSDDSSGCGDLCRDLKKVLEDRTSAFRELNATGSLPGNNVADTSRHRLEETPSGIPVRLAGASRCFVKALPPDSPSSIPATSKTAVVSRVRLTPAGSKHKTATSPPMQFVCYWPEDSTSAAETRFRDLSSLLEFLMPSTWSVHQESQTDELSGAKITVWVAQDPMNKPAVRLYLSGQSVGLHVAASD